MNEDLNTTEPAISLPIPPPIERKLQRNNFGLYNSVTYVYNEDGSINWRKMIKPEFLVPNLEKTQETDITKLKDNEMLILLGGIKDLASLRGFTSVNYRVVTASQEFCCVQCDIDWIPNYETEGRIVSFSSIADAHFGNTENFGRKFLSTIAENRAFVRAVRNFLKINIVGREELENAKTASPKDESSENSESPTPHKMLLELMEQKNVSFERIKARLKKDGVLEAEDYESVYDIKNAQIFELMDLLKQQKA